MINSSFDNLAIRNHDKSLRVRATLGNIVKEREGLSSNVHVAINSNSGRLEVVFEEMASLNGQLSHLFPHQNYEERVIQAGGKPKTVYVLSGTIDKLDRLSELYLQPNQDYPNRNYKNEFIRELNGQDLTEHMYLMGVEESVAATLGWAKRTDKNLPAISFNKETGNLEYESAKGKVVGIDEINRLSGNKIPNDLLISVQNIEKTKKLEIEKSHQLKHYAPIRLLEEANRGNEAGVLAIFKTKFDANYPSEKHYLSDKYLEARAHPKLSEPLKLIRLYQEAGGVDVPAAVAGATSLTQVRQAYQNALQERLVRNAISPKELADINEQDARTTFGYFSRDLVIRNNSKMPENTIVGLINQLPNGYLKGRDEIGVGMGNSMPLMDGIIKRGNIAILKAALDKGLDPNYITLDYSIEGAHPLTQVVLNKSLDSKTKKAMVDELINHGADPNKISAKQKENIPAPVLKYLNEAFAARQSAMATPAVASTPTPTYTTPTPEPAKASISAAPASTFTKESAAVYIQGHLMDKNLYTTNIAKLKEALKVDPTLINKTDAYGATLLHNASFFGAKDAVQFLLDNGAKGQINQPNTSSKSTPLHLAAGNGHLDITNLLIANGADLKTTNKYGATALGTAKHASTETSKQAGAMQQPGGNSSQEEATKLVSKFANLLKTAQALEAAEDSRSAKPATQPKAADLLDFFSASKPTAQPAMTATAKPAQSVDLHGEQSKMTPAEKRKAQAAALKAGGKSKLDEILQAGPKSLGQSTSSSTNVGL